MAYYGTGVMEKGIWGIGVPVMISSLSATEESGR